MLKRLIVISGLLATLVGCAGSGDTATPASTLPATETVTTYHPSGRIMEQGSVVTGSTTRTGTWTVYFDQADGQKQWQGNYDLGIVDPSQPWTEWNADGSTRVTWIDR